MLQCRAKIKELRQAYQQVRKANHCSGAAYKTCPFYKELDTILSDNPTWRLPRASWILQREQNHRKGT
ncbi:hypothetical protein UY3_07178 [Chelonia mydas]|uniref:Uncharacterized protein n=1 Tax=Chelonia mydas TaxID=8469 RepID=M7BCF6_CHEMY|nr:hypothetical protein UY3_07178 [Chelonia mydas]